MTPSTQKSVDGTRCVVSLALRPPHSLSVRTTGTERSALRGKQMRQRSQHLHVLAVTPQTASDCAFSLAALFSFHFSPHASSAHGSRTLAGATRKPHCSALKKTKRDGNPAARPAAEAPKKRAPPAHRRWTPSEARRAVWRGSTRAAKRRQRSRSPPPTHRSMLLRACAPFPGGVQTRQQGLDQHGETSTRRNAKREAPGVPKRRGKNKHGQARKQKSAGETSWGEEDVDAAHSRTHTQQNEKKKSRA